MLAILYDVHGNLPALDAVLADAQQAGATRHRIGGDVSAFGAWPLECLQRLQALPDAAWIRGNWERWQGAPQAAPDDPVIQGAAAAAIAALGPGRVAELAALPATDVAGGTLFCHASPLSDMEPFTRQDDTESDDQLLAHVPQRRVVFGHTHVQFRRLSAGGIDLVNPGSVGLPWDGDRRAAYALAHDDGTLELRRVVYDVAEAVGALRAIGAPWATATARRLQAAAFEA